MREIPGLGIYDLLRFDTVDVRAARIEPVHLDLVNVEAGDAKARPAEEQDQGKPNITQADDANSQLTVLYKR